MNSYEFHIGDYYRETRNLSQTEHYIYRSLLDECYLHETPLTTDIRMLMRIIGLTSDQKEDLEYILGRFFILTDDGWTNNRANEELARIYAKSELAKASADVRWEKHRKNANAKERDANAMRTHSERNANGMLPSDPLTPLPSDPKELAPTVLVDAATPAPTCPHQKIVDSYHKHFPAGPMVKVITDKRKKAIKARWANGGNGLDFWDAYFKHAAKSRFLVGNNERNWIADFDFFIRPDTATFMQEGKYHK